MPCSEDFERVIRAANELRKLLFRFLEDGRKY